MSGSRILSWIVLASALASLGCDREKGTTQTQESSAPASTPSIETLPPDSGPPPAFDGARAMQYVKEIVKFGPRPLASENHKKVEAYLDSRVKADQVEDDTFTADTPVGKFPVHNIVAKFPGTKDGVIIIASHYDTNYPLRNTSYVGANDGASSSALLLEIANQLRGKTRDGYSIWLVWDDAEEAMVPDTEMDFMADSLYGITHLAEKWQADGTLKKVKAFLLADMIGDSDLEHRSRSKLNPLAGRRSRRGREAPGLSITFLRAHQHSLRRSLPFVNTRRAVRRSHRLHLRLQQRLLAHARKTPSTSSAPRVWKSSAASFSRPRASSTRWILCRPSDYGDCRA